MNVYSSSMLPVGSLIYSPAVGSHAGDMVEGIYVDETTFSKTKEGPDGTIIADTENYIPETGEIYVSVDDGKIYRWNGSKYEEISKSIELGEISATAYPGNLGKQNADNINKLIEGKVDRLQFDNSIELRNYTDNVREGTIAVVNRKCTPLTELSIGTIINDLRIDTSYLSDDYWVNAGDEYKVDLDVGSEVTLYLTLSNDIEVRVGGNVVAYWQGNASSTSGWWTDNTKATRLNNLEDLGIQNIELNYTAKRFEDIGFLVSYENTTTSYIKRNNEWVEIIDENQLKTKTSTLSDKLSNDITQAVATIQEEKAPILHFPDLETMYSIKPSQGTIGVIDLPTWKSLPIENPSSYKVIGLDIDTSIPISEELITQLTKDEEDTILSNNAVYLRKEGNEIYIYTDIYWGRDVNYTYDIVSQTWTKKGADHLLNISGYLQSDVNTELFNFIKVNEVPDTSMFEGVYIYSNNDWYPMHALAQEIPTYECDEDNIVWSDEEQTEFKIRTNKIFLTVLGKRTNLHSNNTELGVDQRTAMKLYINTTMGAPTVFFIAGSGYNTRVLAIKSYPTGNKLACEFWTCLRERTSYTFNKLPQLHELTQTEVDNICIID